MLVAGISGISWSERGGPSSHLAGVILSFWLFVVNWLPQTCPKSTPGLTWMIEKRKKSLQTFVLAPWISSLTKEGEDWQWSPLVVTVSGWGDIQWLWPLKHHTNTNMEPEEGPFSIWIHGFNDQIHRWCAAINSRDGTVRRWFTWRLHNSKVARRRGLKRLRRFFLVGLGLRPVGLFSKNSKQCFFCSLFRCMYFPQKLLDKYTVPMFFFFNVVCFGSNYCTRIFLVRFVSQHKQASI